MYFTSLELLNFGLYKGLQKIDFPSPTVDQRITLVGGLNGRGKTTIIEAIFLVLFGPRSIRYLQDERISYSEFLRRHTNKSSLDQEAAITLNLNLGDTGDSLKIRRFWRITDSGVNDGFAVYKNGQEDRYLAESWDYYVEEIIPLGIARFFFFDSEKIAQIADEESYEKVKESIQVLLGINTIEKLIEDMKKLIKRNTVTRLNSEMECYDKDLAILNLQLDELEKDIASSVLSLGRLRRELGFSQNKLEEYEQEFWNRGGNFGLKKEEVVKEKELLIDELSIKNQTMQDLICRSSTPLLLCNNLLNLTFNQVQQDEKVRSAKNSYKLINELKEILYKSVELHDNQMIILDFLKTVQNQYAASAEDNSKLSISPASQLLLESLVVNIEKEKNFSHTLINEIKNIENRISQIEMQLNFQSESSDSQSIWHSMKQLHQQITILKTQISNEETQQQTLLNKKASIENQQVVLLREEISKHQSDEENDRSVKYASITLSVMNEFKIRLQQHRVKELGKQIFECFSFIAQKQKMIQRIDIDSESLDMKLVDYSGGELLKSQLSAGEKQIFAISILWGLAKCSGYQLPVIVDTPLGRLDSHHRSTFVKRYLPFASQQVIVLSTDEEIAGQYYDLIKSHVNSRFILEYDEQEKTTSIVRGYFGGHYHDN
ncbi:DNA replication and repair protein RecF [Sporomusaceae bacterium FL31]|nr:DNA replication and repair protein RecF [Sporomusaceae bacterium FL31]GCE32798.1 DNA replication and repair protein RecF [Sporomusaceae bacterium]